MTTTDSQVLYTPSLRSSHLERLAPQPGFRLLATHCHPDCDPVALAAAPFPVLVADLDTLVRNLLADPPAVLEVTEPMWVAEWPASLRLAAAVPRSRLVTYAIEVLPPASPPDPGRLSAVAFGSAAAQAAYAITYPRAAWTSVVLEERRGRCGTCFPAAVRDGTGGAGAVEAAAEIVFAAEFSERKAIDLLMAAWSQVAPAGWRLRLLGWGPRTDQVLQWATGRPDVDVVVGAGREQVHRALRRAAVVVLPSRRVPGWREQIGLSLVEGLAHGCHLLTTDETGLADGLRANGHTVVRAGDLAALAAGLLDATAAVQESPDQMGRLRKRLPPLQQDSRRRVQRWLAELPTASR